MKLHRFFSKKEIKGGHITYYDVSGQWRRVFRFKAKDQVILFDGSGNDYFCEINQYKDGVASLSVLHIIEPSLDRNSIRHVSLVSAVVKKDIFEWIVQKATELGVSDIFPVLATRSEKKNLNIERLEKIIIEASEQSGRGTIPTLHPIAHLIDFYTKIKAYFKAGYKIIVFHPSAEKFSENDFKVKDAENILICIGPEGGWTTEELDIFKKDGALIISLGPQILRAETAVVSALSRVVF